MYDFDKSLLFDNSTKVGFFEFSLNVYISTFQKCAFWPKFDKSGLFRIFDTSVLFDFSKKIVPFDNNSTKVCFLNFQQILAFRQFYKSGLFWIFDKYVLFGILTKLCFLTTIRQEHAFRIFDKCLRAFPQFKRSVFLDTIDGKRTNSLMSCFSLWKVQTGQNIMKLILA